MALTKISRGFRGLYAKHVNDTFKEIVKIDFEIGKLVKEASGPRKGDFSYYETYIPNNWGELTKWMNNGTWFDDDLLQEHPHIEAFVHYIYAKTNGVMTIMDVQGKFIKR